MFAKQDKKHDKLIEYVDKKIDEEQVRTDNQVKGIDKKISNVAIVSISLFAVIIVILLAYQLL